jgi:PAS domain S-box-containing protein
MTSDALRSLGAVTSRQCNLLERIVETSPAGIVVVDASGQISFCNAAGERILGITRDEATNRTYNAPDWRIADAAGNPLPDEDLPFRKVLTQRVPVHAERHTIVRADGRRVLLSISAAPLLQPDGTFDGMVAALEDVTETVDAERALTESEERYRRITAAVTDYIYSVRIENGRAVETRHGVGCAAVTGYTSEEFVADAFLWYSMVVEEDRPLVEALLGQVTAGETPAPITHRIVRKDGQVRWVRNTLVLHRDADGAVIACDGLIHDVTERTRAQEALRLSERRFRSVVDACPMGIHQYELDEQERLIFSGFNPAADAILGVDHRAHLGRTIEGAFPPLAQTEVPARYRAVAHDGVSWHTEQVEYEDERVVGAFEVFAFQTQPRAMAVLFRDVTERKRMERALRESETRLASIVRVAPSGIGLVVDRVLKQVNDRLCEMIGYAREELVGQSARVLYPSDEDFEFVGREKYRQIAERGTGTVETRWRCKDGRLIDVLLSSTPLDPGDLSLGVTFTALDITERKRMERALGESEERLRLAVETADLGYWDWDVMAGRMTYGGRLDAIFGRTLAPLVERPEDFFGLTYPDDLPRLASVREGLLGAAAGFDIEMRILRPDGSVRWVASRGQAHRDAAGHLTRVLGVTQDITERRRAEQERRELEARLQQQQRLESLGTLAAGVAHEINNPLNGIMNYAQLIVNRLDDSSPARRHARCIVEESERVSEIVRNLLAFARQETQTPSAARLPDVVARTLALLRALLRKDQIVVEAHIPDDLPALKCRPQQVQQVLLNLITNARDALNERFPGGSPEKIIRVSARVLDEQGRRWLRTTVQDGGAGVAPEIAARIFEPFFTTKPRDVGTGLGLSISYGIIKAHHGRLQLESEPDGPTRFHFDLPLGEDVPVEGRANGSSRVV